MAVKICGDIDKVYTDSSAECFKIASYIYSKGDLATNKVSNKFCNIEILKANNLCYLVITSGRLGEATTATVRRFSGEQMVKVLYLDECKKRLRSGYKEVEVVSIYPNCSAAAQSFVTEKNLIDEKSAKNIVSENKELAQKIEDSVSKTKEEKIEKLNPKVKSFVETIYDAANQQLKVSINPTLFQNKSNPLGTIDHIMIQRGRGILDEIGKLQNKLAVAKRNRDGYMNEIAMLSNEYNMTIPRVLKRNTTDWLLDTGEKVMAQFDLLDVLEVSLSTAVLNSEHSSDILGKYHGLRSEIHLVEDKEIINSIREKMKTEQLHNHHFGTRLINVFEVNQLNAPTFDASCGNVVSLFHGTGVANLLSILSTSLKLPHNLGANVPITGHMFGAGVYFGEYSKTLQYATGRFTGRRGKGNRYYLLLCDVALGKIKMETRATFYAQAPRGYNSVMGVGEDDFKTGCNIKGIGGTKDLVIPSGSFKKQLGAVPIYLLHNEFIVYNQNRFKIRYIVEVEGAN